jgi:hypothetical protein
LTRVWRSRLAHLSYTQEVMGSSPITRIFCRGNDEKIRKSG